jgi:transposase InsO family protein
MSRKGNSLDNQPVEYLHSIFKEEYLNDIKIKDRTFENVNNCLRKFVNEYNNKRIQSCLN